MPFGNNYGGILQAWALQETLRRMGHEVVMLNRQPGCPPVGRLFRRFLSIGKCIVKKYIGKDKDVVICSPFVADYRAYNYDDSQLRYFISEQFRRTPLLRSSNALLRYVNDSKLEAVVVGSDQVWRQLYSPCITDFFLAFLPQDSAVKRIAYAASFGTGTCDIAPKHLPACQAALKLFDAVSVRETTGRDILERTFSTEAPVVLDPTLLLDRQDYESIMEQGCQPLQGGLARYVLDDADFKEQIIDDVARTLGLPLRPLTDHPHDDEGRLGKLDSISFWLTVIASSKYVVTDSFHGSVFSILFNKPFLVIANKNRGIDRLTSLLDQFGLQERLVFSWEEYLRKKHFLLSEMDYASVNLRRKALKERSLSFLARSLSKAEGRVSTN